MAAGPDQKRARRKRIMTVIVTVSQYFMRAASGKRGRSFLLLEHFQQKREAVLHRIMRRQKEMERFCEPVLTGNALYSDHLIPRGSFVF
ncbi:Hypothetical protein OINT_2000433 [Brucella intermedia LMG 3301]|uniref:Uncharacterized protein n=2 Tax=Brucella intermedia TaxID=94625 RepID=C4WMX6_9HYPH|nr:Hypothetical protein OINT_2000433 [Brucella intermedia LMG 3301]ELT47992.1 hypothetical protein D584_17194 [Brucella intermedia M86]OOC65093.1 hypothetical protein AS855_13240 [Brucella intermedia M86]SUA87985.1 Uncharacterised protein [Brucella intermedia]